MHSYHASRHQTADLANQPESKAGRLRGDATVIDSWLDRHAVAVDMDGETVTSLFLSDEVVGYRIEGMLISARSSDGVISRMARRLSCSHHLGDNGIALLQQALETLREELRQQPLQL
ncbi:MAG: hypothetical protein LAT61_00525 [Alcanivorax sp.]|nr:hypothetical protein [Alcanivorax sp.]